MFRRGFWVNILNPKAIVLPRLRAAVHPPDQEPLPQYLILISTSVSWTLVMWFFAAAAKRSAGSREARGQRILNGVFGSLFIAVAGLLLLVH